MKKKGLRHGYTTGACAAAAAKGAAAMLRGRRRLDEVEITLPGGETALFRLHGQEISGNRSSCFVIKDAGDDPDVTNGAEIHAEVTFFPPSPQPSPTRGEGDPGEIPLLVTSPPPLVGGGKGEGREIIIQGGQGVGRVTKPGLAVPVGEWAINPVPRRMIREAVCEVFTPHPSPLTPRVIISIPNGEELARKTLNARLGILGGLSILGTTGIVRPISAQAWTDTIEAATDVALACGCDTLVLSTGRTSELAAQRFFSAVEDPAQNTPFPFSSARCPLPEESFIMMGDHVGFAVRTCARKGVGGLVLAGQFAKILKIACWHEQTHVSSSRLDLSKLAEWLENAPCSPLPAHCVSKAGTAREVLEISGNNAALIAMVCERAAEFVRQLAPGLRAKVLLAGYGGEVLYYGPDSR